MTNTMQRPLALVTGASSGIGFELARQFAEHGYDLLINAEDEAIREAATQLQTSGARVEPIQADLRTHAGVEQLYDAVTHAGRPLEAVALNAGIGQGGAFVDEDLADELAVVDVNVRSTVHLAKRVLTDMSARNHGKVLITSSIASTMPGPYNAVYNASKSFLQSFAEALQTELKDTDITVTSLMPGPTDTEFFERADLEDTQLGQSKKDDPAEVAKEGFEALMSGKPRVVAGSFKNKAQAVAGRVLPDKVKSAMHGKMSKPQE